MRLISRGTSAFHRVAMNGVVESTMKTKEEEEQVPKNITTAESSTARRQSDLTAVSTDSSNENPFMTLVDAAASLLDT